MQGRVKKTDVRRSALTLKLQLSEETGCTDHEDLESVGPINCPLHDFQATVAGT